MEIIISKADKPNKKYMALVDGKRTIYFGATGYSDFTIHKDEARKQRYLKRHGKNEQWNNPLTAGFYATNLLWNQPTLKQSINDINKRYNINAKLK